jgi:hypothetical protein
MHVSTAMKTSMPVPLKLNTIRTTLDKVAILQIAGDRSVSTTASQAGHWKGNIAHSPVRHVICQIRRRIRPAGLHSTDSRPSVPHVTTMFIGINL